MSSQEQKLNIPEEALKRDTYRVVINGNLYWESIHAGLFPATHPFPKPENWVSPQTIALKRTHVMTRHHGKWLYPCDADEILIGGHRGGGKSDCMIVWVGRGNRNLPMGDPIRASYLNHRNYRAIIFRRNATDLKDFQSKFERFWGPLKPKRHGDPPYYEFPSGARVYTNHLEDESSYEKYKGWEFHSIGIEELTHIPTLDLYLKVLGSLRASLSGAHAGLIPQVLSTTNPDGPGALWVRDRFVYLYNKGNLIPWGTVMTHPVTKRTRVFIPAKLEDNPYLDADTKKEIKDGKEIFTPGSYRSNLMEQPTHIRRAWLHGDWDAMRGAAFPDFRPQGPKPGDIQPERARHVLPASSFELKPWWTRWIACDWGYSHKLAVGWFCQSDTGQMIQYRELVLTGVNSQDCGIEIARQSLKDLQTIPSHQMNMVLSHDVMRYTDEAHTIGSQMAFGMETIIGSGSTFLMQYTLEEQELKRQDPQAAWFSRQRRWDSMDSNTSITILPASRDRIGGWNYIRSLMRWWRTAAPTYSEVEAQTIYRKSGEAEMEKYVRKSAAARRQQDEVLPKLVILDCCPKTIRALRDATCDEPPRQEDLPKGDQEWHDVCDMIRYGAMAHRDMVSAQPKQYYIADKMAQARKDGITDMTLLAQMAAIAEQNYDKEEGVMDMRPWRAPRTCIPDARQQFGNQWPSGLQ